MHVPKHEAVQYSNEGLACALLQEDAIQKACHHSSTAWQTLSVLLCVSGLPSSVKSALSLVQRKDLNFPRQFSGLLELPKQNISEPRSLFSVGTNESLSKGSYEWMA